MLFFSKKLLCRINTILLAFMALCLTTGCGTFTPYPELEIPEDQIATLKCYWRDYFLYSDDCTIRSVDDRETGVSEMFSRSAKIPPGNHKVVIDRTTAFAGGIGGGVCSFKFNFEAGFTYQIKAHSFESDSLWWEAGFNHGTMEINATSAESTSQIQKVKITCGF